MKMQSHSLTVGDAFKKIKIPPVHKSLHNIPFLTPACQREGSQKQFTCFQTVIQIFVFSVVFIKQHQQQYKDKIACFGFFLYFLSLSKILCL